MMVPPTTSYLGSVDLELWEDLWVDHVELSLDHVAPDVVYRADVLVEDQVFCGGREPADTEALSLKVQHGFL